MTWGRKDQEKPNDIKSLAVFKLIGEYGPISRSELSQLTGFSLPTVGKYVQKLIEQGRVTEARDDNDSKRKRRTRLLEINPSFGPALGIEVGGSQLQWVITNLGGKVLNAGIQKVEEGKILDALESCIRIVLSQMKVRVIGIASTGIVETKKGVSLHSPHRGDMDDLPLKEFCERKFGLPVYVDDISRSSAVAEWRLGVLRGERNFAYLFLDEGIGLSWAVDGVLYYGPYGISGEVGHFVIDEDGPRCGCGNRGCLEVFASCKAIARSAQKALQAGVTSSLAGKEVTIEGIVSEALRGDKLCYNLLVEAGEYIGRAMAQVLNLTGVPLIVLGGSLSRAGNLIVEPIKRMIRADALSLLGEHLEIRVSSLGREAGTLGAAMQSLLNVLGILRNEGAISLKGVSLVGGWVK